MIEWINLIVGYLARIIEACGALVILHGAGRTMLFYVRDHILRHHGAHVSALRLLFGHYLTLGLEFELAADILLTIIEPTWERLGLLGAVIAMRTILSFFLEYELAAMEKRREYSEPLTNGDME